MLQRGEGGGSVEQSPGMGRMLTFGDSASSVFIARRHCLGYGDKGLRCCCSLGSRRQSTSRHS